MGKAKFLKTLLLLFDKFGFFNFGDINIEKFDGTSFAIVVTETFYFWHKVFFLQVVNFLLLLFWNLHVLHKLWHCFLHSFNKSFVKKLITIFIIAASINVIAKDIFIVQTKLQAILSSPAKNISSLCSQQKMAFLTQNPEHIWKLHIHRGNNSGKNKLL